MLMRLLRLSAVLLVAAVSFWTVDRAWGEGFYLRQTKDQLKLKYEVAVEEHGSGRVTVVFTLADEGRLKPLEAVQLVIPAQEQNQDGSRWMDLVVSIDMAETDGGKHVGRIHLLKGLAERAEIQLNTHTMDGKLDPFTRLHHVIPIAKYMKHAPAAATRLPADGVCPKTPSSSPESLCQNDVFGQSRRWAPGADPNLTSPKIVRASRKSFPQ